MPGAYAHITLVNEAREPARLEAAGLRPEARLALGRWLSYAELGAVSPDYPYLVVNKSANKWADLMHYQHSGEMIKAGVDVVKGLAGPEREKAFAWLLGYMAHVVTDVTIHPVVELKVGDYEQHKKEHRICEMNQDAYIYHRLNLGDVGQAEHLDSGVSHCSEADGSISESIAGVWQEMLQRCHTDAFAANPPRINDWHLGFRSMVDTIAEEGYRLVPLARHVAVDCGLTYPAFDNVDRAEFIDHLETPAGVLTYDQVFDRAREHVIRHWCVVADGVTRNSNAYQTVFGNWNLDTGRDETGKLVLWEA